MLLRLSGQMGRFLFAFAALACLVVASPTGAGDGVAIVGPPDGAFVSGHVVITAVAPPETAWVEFSWSVDGAVWSRIAIDGDGADGWQVVWDSRPHNGVVTLRATASGGASATVTVTVDNTAPVVRALLAPTYFSPNGDGRKDATVLTVAVRERALVDIRVLDRAGNLVDVLADDLAIEGGIRVPWNGRSADGARARDGAYRLVVEALDAAGNAASTAATIRLDTTAPRLTWRSRADIVGVVSLKVSFRMYDASAPFSGHFRLVNAYERVVRTWQRRLSPGAGSSTLARRTLLSIAPGVYRVGAVISDAAGNRSSARLSPAYRLDHSARTRVVARVDNAGPHVALTFDDCFFPSSWNSILRTLARNRVKAAFFCPGYLVRAFPDLAARTVRAGHTIGSHGWDHALLPASAYGNILWRLKRDRNVWWRWREAAVPYFRPPYGAYNSTVLSAAAAAGYRYTVVWDVDTRDWTNPGPSAIVSRAVQPARAGSIILLHVKPQTASALPLIIRRLRNRGLTPIGLDELIHRRGAMSSRSGWSATSARMLEPSPTGERSAAAGLASRLLRVPARIRRVLVAALRSHSDRDGPAEPFRARAAKTHRSLAVPVAGTALAGTTVPSAVARPRARPRWLSGVSITEYFPVPERWFVGRRVRAPGLPGLHRIDWLYSARGLSMEGDGVGLDGRRYHIDDLGRPGWVNARGHPTRPTRRAGRWTKGQPFWRAGGFWRNVFGRPTFPLGDGAWFDGNGTRFVRPPKGISFGPGPSRPLRFWKSVAVDPDVIALGSRIYIPAYRHLRGRGWFRADDVGSAIIGRHLDVFRPPPRTAGGGQFLHDQRVYVIPPLSAAP